MLSTRAGWLGPVEIVEVEYDPARVGYARLLEHAVDRDCALAVFTTTTEQRDLARRRVGERARPVEGEPRWVKDQKYYLARTPLRHVPMTRLQAARINADLENAEAYLSPRQRRVLAAVRADASGWPDAVDRDLAEAWPAAWARVTDG